MRNVKVMILRTAGTNCDVETAYAFETAGAKCDFIHINRLLQKKRLLQKFHILAIPGGFTYGDDIASGKILANEIKYNLMDELKRFIKDGKLIIGICNGFQVLVKAGILPNTTGDIFKIEATLTINDSDKFEDRWVYLRRPSLNPDFVYPQSGSPRYQSKQTCVWTKGMNSMIYLPVAHGEGKFVTRDRRVLKKLEENGQIVLKYCDEKGDEKGYPWNPNGSVRNIAGICDISGRVFGLMPHPERHIRHTQHPQWTRNTKKNAPDGLNIFHNGVSEASKL